MSAADTNPAHAKLGDESFMSAEDLRDYMTEIELAKANKEIAAMDRADKAREELIKTLMEPINITPELVSEISARLATNMRHAAQNGETEMMVMRFPVQLCEDKGRAINNAEEGWPDTLTGRPRQAYEFWRDHLREKHFKLKAMIVEWPGGMPGDVGLFLSWA